MNTIPKEYLFNKRKFEIIFKFNGKTYTMHDVGSYSLYHIYEDGNNSCDCNRSLLIRKHCDKNFPIMDCGEKIKLVSIREVS